MKTILFQGDSITDCGRLTTGGAGYPQVNLGPGYVGLIASRILLDYAGKNYSILNRGISGNRVVDLYARWKIDALNLDPDIISILIGVNDSWHEIESANGVELPRYDEFLRRLLSWSREHNPKVNLVLLEPFLIPQTPQQESMMAEVRERAKIVRQAAADFQAIFIPLQDKLEQAVRSVSKEYFVVDGVHPNLAGHQLIADAWLAAVGKLL